MKNINDAVTSLKAEISRLQGVLSHLEGDAAAAISSGTDSVIKSAKKMLGMKPAKKTKLPSAGKGRRIRRSSEEVKAQAMEMVTFIKSKGKTGATGKEIAAKFGPVLPSIKVFINGRVDAESKVKSKGAANKTVYFA